MTPHVHSWKDTCAEHRDIIAILLSLLLPLSLYYYYYYIIILLLLLLLHYHQKWGFNKDFLQHFVLVVVMSVTLLLSLITIGIYDNYYPRHRICCQTRAFRHLLYQIIATLLHAFIIAFCIIFRFSLFVIAVFIEFIEHYYLRYADLFFFIHYCLFLHKHRGTTLVAN